MKKILSCFLPHHAVSSTLVGQYSRLRGRSHFMSTLGPHLYTYKRRNFFSPSFLGWVSRSVAWCGTTYEIGSLKRWLHWTTPMSYRWGHAFDLPRKVNEFEEGDKGEDSQKSPRKLSIAKEEQMNMLPSSMYPKSASEEALRVTRYDWKIQQRFSRSSPGKGDKDVNISFDDLGKYLLISLDELTELIPEGFAGEMMNDITLMPSSQLPFGVMLRKPMMEIITELASYQYFQNLKKEYYIPSSGLHIDGHRGTGKSFVINYLVAWLRKQGWLVVFEPKASRYSKEVGIIRRSAAGLFIQNEFSQNFLERLAAYNQSILESIPVIPQVFGNCALDGSHRLYYQRAYDDLIRKSIQDKQRSFSQDGQDISEAEKNVHGSSLKEKALKTSLEGSLDDFNLELKLEELRLWREYRSKLRFSSLRDRLAPDNLWQIVEYGLKNETFATQCVYELFEQLKKQTKFPMAIIVDEWNDCFPVSKYLSMKYEDTKYGGWIPSYHLTMPRLFHRWDGHDYKRGVKIVATSWKACKRRNYQPELLGVRPEEMRTIRNFGLGEFQHYVCNYLRAGILSEFPAERLEYFYMLTGGNGFQCRRLLTTFY